MGKPLKPLSSLKLATFDKAEWMPRILVELRKGDSLAKVCQIEGFPTHQRVHEWMKESRDFAADIARARDEGFDAFADETLRIACDGSQDIIVDDKGREKVNNEIVARSRLIVETRLKLLACRSPRYRLDQPPTNVSVAVGVGVTVTEADRAALVKARREALTSGGAGAGRVIESPSTTTIDTKPAP